MNLVSDASTAVPPHNDDPLVWNSQFFLLAHKFKFAYKKTQVLWLATPQLPKNFLLQMT
jgi:hypothetical protein